MPKAINARNVHPISTTILYPNFVIRNVEMENDILCSVTTETTIILMDALLTAKLK